MCGQKCSVLLSNPLNDTPSLLYIDYCSLATGTEFAYNSNTVTG